MSKFNQKSIMLLSAMMFSVNIADAASIKTPKAVVEVFTSQGCHSCPPADKIVEKYAKDGDILSISVHVDYWDYLGWKDVFASKGNTLRQYGYARSMRESQVYTPQAVINGRNHVVGSRESAIQQVISQHNARGIGLTVPINASVNDNSIGISIDAGANVGDATLYLVSLKKAASVDIKRGENTGKTIEYHNIMSDLQPLGMIKPEGLNIEYPISDLKRNGHDRFAFILQSMSDKGDPGPIIGAVYIEDL
ncbi:MAG: DUF1223 domain-containing protein [Rhizobiaceae bacterium]|nr:DUF1223 domain-containing protein [Rhizobiaceae bacterium]